MMKIIDNETICNLFTVTVDRFNTDKKIGDILTDEYGRKFNINSVAFTNNHDTTTFVLTPLDGKCIIGSVLN